MIITESLSTIMASENCTPTEMLDYPSMGNSPVTREYQVMKRLTRQKKKRWTRIYQPLKNTRQTKMEKRKQRDERKETGRRQKEGYKKNVKERASRNI
jgi:hypothetical protein